MTCPKDIDTALQRFKDVSDSYRNKDTFWEYFYTQVPQGDIAKFLETLLASEQMDFYEIDHAFSLLPEHWKRKPSVMRRWPDIIKLVAKFSALNYWIPMSGKNFKGIENKGFRETLGL